MLNNQDYIEAQRRRSARFVTIVYAAMALIFSLIAITIANASETLAIPTDTAMFMASAFATLAATNIVILELWARLYKIPA